jgi:hypothetical protein
MLMNYGVMHGYFIDRNSGQFKAPFNTIYNEARVFTYKDTAIVTPNSDTHAGGSLTFYVQHKSPGKDKESNWLPAPDGPIYMVMRLYWPKKGAAIGAATRRGNLEAAGDRRGEIAAYTVMLPSVTFVSSGRDSGTNLEWTSY